MPGCLYRLRFPNGKDYIGVALRGLDIRWHEHLMRATSGRGHAVNRAIEKYGADAVVREILLVADDFAFLLDMEVAAIAAFGTKAPRGYNLTGGGEGLRELAREAVLARTATLQGNPERVAAWRSKLSAAWTETKRQRRSEETKALWAGEYGDRLRASHEARRMPPRPKVLLSAEERRVTRVRGWTPQKRQAQALRIALAAKGRSEELSEAQHKVMADPEMRAQIARSLSQHANSLFSRGRKPVRGGFTRHIWDQIPEPATFDQLFALGFSKGRLGKALRNGNLVVIHASPDKPGEEHPVPERP